MRYEILVDKVERPGKCTILPLAGRGDFRIVRFDRRDVPPSPTGDLLLHPDGEPLDRWRQRSSGDRGDLVVSAIDCNWVRLGRFLARMTGTLPVRVRIPAGFVTAYRRRNKQDNDPASGLATIEALFLAAAFLGNRDETLLSEYPEAQRFLEINAPMFAHYRLGPAIPSPLLLLAKA